MIEGIPGEEDDFSSQFPGSYLFRFVIWLAPCSVYVTGNTFGQLLYFQLEVKVFSRVSKKRHPGKRHFTFLNKKASTVIYIEEG